MTIQPVIITCPGREAMLGQTLANWERTDFGHVQPMIQMDSNTCERRQERQVNNSLSALKRACGGPADFILFLEDDLEFNLHLYHNLCRWKPAQRGTLFSFGSLYNPTIGEQLVCDRLNYFIANPNCAYGSQAYLLSRAFAGYCIAHWGEIEGMQDICITRMAARLGDLYYHRPSLVQHVGIVSTWGGAVHTAPDFSKEFKASA